MLETGSSTCGLVGFGSEGTGRTGVTGSGRFIGFRSAVESTTSINRPALRTPTAPGVAVDLVTFLDAEMLACFGAAVGMVACRLGIDTRCTGCALGVELVS